MIDSGSVRVLPLIYAELVYQWIKQSVGRYGKTAVERWYWELWNDAVKRALPTIKIGGPETTNPGNNRADELQRENRR